MGVGGGGCTGGGFTILGGGGGVCTPVGLVQQRCKGGARKSNTEIWHNFHAHGFSLSEVKLKLTIQYAHIAENGISRVIIVKIFWGHTPGPPRELAPSALESLGSQFI